MDFQIFKFMVAQLVGRAIVHCCTKFIKIVERLPFSKWRPSAILDLKK